MDRFIEMKFSNFYNTNNGMIEPTCERLDKWKQNVQSIKFVTYDNAGEKTKLKKASNSKAWKLNL